MPSVEVEFKDATAGLSSVLSWMPVMWSSMHFNPFGRCWGFAFLLLKRTGWLSLTEVWLCSNFHTKFSYGHVVCVNSHINFLVLIQSSTCLSFVFAPSVRMDSSPTLTQLLFLVSYINLWKLHLVFLWLALMFRSSAGSLVFLVTWLVLKYSLLDVQPQNCTQFMRCNCLRSYSAAAGTLVFPYNFGDSWPVWDFFSHFQGITFWANAWSLHDFL